MARNNLQPTNARHRYRIEQVLIRGSAPHGTPCLESTQSQIRERARELIERELTRDFDEARTAPPTALTHQTLRRDNDAEDAKRNCVFVEGFTTVCHVKLLS